jgi:hypothetical protein
MELGHKEALDAFIKQKARAEEGNNAKKGSKLIKLDGYKLGETEQEKQYRRWCLANRLFLNPLNDLGPHTVAARDTMTLPDFTTKLQEPPSLVGFFNQMKQEFVSARWMFYDGMHGTGSSRSGGMMSAFTGSSAVACTSAGRPANCASSPRKLPGPWVTIGW